MRRFLSIALILLFWMGPLTAVFAANSDESGLPACCRRHGAHHCAMSEETAAALAAENSGPIFRAPSRCPFFPHSLAVLSGFTAGLISATAQQPDAIATLHKAASRHHSISLRAIDARSSRGPPATTFA